VVVLPFVVAYSGGSVEESFKFHNKALASLACLRLLSVRSVRLRYRIPRRLAIILDLKFEVHLTSLSSPCGHRWSCIWASAGQQQNMLWPTT